MSYELPQLRSRRPGRVAPRSGADGPRRRRPAGRLNWRRHRTAQRGRPGRSADQGRHAAERDALLHPRQPGAAQSRRAQARRQRRLDPRGREPARARPHGRAHGVQRLEELPQQPDRRLHAGHRHALRRARQRAHRFRRDRVPAADSDRGSVDRRSLVPRARGLGAERHVRSRRDRQGARRRPRRVAAGAGPRRPHARLAAAGAAEGIALRGADADRHAGDPPHVQARGADEVLRRLVSPGPDGGDRRRRLRSGRDRAPDHGALRPDPGAGRRASEADLRRAGSSGDAVRRRHRSRGDADGRQRDEHDARARPDDDRRLPAEPGGAAVLRHADGSSRRARARA